MKTRSMILGAALLAIGTLAQSPAGAAGSVTVNNATRNGDTLTVTGGSTFADQAFQTVATDPTGDPLTPGQDVLGGDLVKAEMASLGNGGLAVRWTVSQLPPTLNGSPGFVYGWGVCTDETTCFEIDASRFNTASGSTDATYGNVWRCATPDCAPADQTLLTDTVTPVIDGTAKTITMNIPANILGISGGTSIAGGGPATTGHVFVGHGDLSLATYFYNNGDGANMEEPFVVARREVSVAVDAPGQDPASLTYGAAVTPASNGSFTASVDVAGQSGDRTVYVRACLGAGNCAFGTKDVTL